MAGACPRVCMCVRAGAHPGHPGECAPDRLGLAERYFLAVADVPRLEARLNAMSYIKGFDSTAAKVQVRARGRTALKARLEKCRPLSFATAHLDKEALSEWAS